MKRRSFLKSAASMLALIGGTTIGFRDPAIAAHEPHIANNDEHGHDHEIDGTPATVDHDFLHRGRRVQVLRREQGIGKGPQIRVAIDGREQPRHVFCDVGSNYGSHLLPFASYRRPQDLAKALIDNDGILYVL